MSTKNSSIGYVLKDPKSGNYLRSGTGHMGPYRYMVKSLVFATVWESKISCQSDRDDQDDFSTFKDLPKLEIVKVIISEK